VEAERVTQHTVLDGAWALLLSGTSGRDDVLFGTTVSGRDLNVPGIEDMVGLLIHVLPARVRIEADQDVWTWLRALQAAQVAARAHQHLPMDEVRRCAAVPAEVPLFRTMVVFENYPLDLSTSRRAGLRVALQPGYGSPTHYALAVGGTPGARLKLALDYDLARFDPQIIERLAEQLAQIIRGMLDAPAPRLGALRALIAPPGRNAATDPRGWPG
jgi:non-ribosomal peptide synthetase component F